MSPIPVRSWVEIIHGFLRVLSLIWSPRIMRVRGGWDHGLIMAGPTSVDIKKLIKDN